MKVINNMQDFVEWLEGLADGTEKLFDEKFGLCYHIETVYDNYMSEEFISKWDDLVAMDDIFSSWDKFSGIRGYPVPAPEGEDICPIVIYEHYNEYDLNKWVGAYGDLRKELCRHIAKELERLIEVN